MPLKHLVHRTARALGYRIERIEPKPHYAGETSRHEYQRRYVRFDIQAGDAVLDIGCGADPLPEATMVVDRYPQPTRHRHSPLDTQGKPLVLADIHHLPFSDKAFDFVYCAHVLEHVDDPIAACRQIMRVGRRGFIETPALAKDLLFSWAQGMHRWHVQAIADTLVFFEYSPRLVQGIRSPAWRRLILGEERHPLQDAFYDNQDVFNTMLPWTGGFQVVVFTLDGRIRSHDGRTFTAQAVPAPALAA